MVERRSHLKAIAVSVVVTLQPSITLACLSHLSDWLRVIWVPSDPTLICIKHTQTLTR